MDPSMKLLPSNDDILSSDDVSQPTSPTSQAGAQSTSSDNAPPVSPSKHTSSSYSSTYRKSRNKGKHESGRPCKEHTFLTDVADVREMEQGLLKLLDDFHTGKLQSFGNDCTFEKLDHVRAQQEQLARLHFELDSQQEVCRLESEEGRQVAKKHMDKLMEKLQELNNSISNLQKSEINPSIQKRSSKNTKTRDDR